MPVILSVVIQVALIVHVLPTAKLAPRHYRKVQHKWKAEATGGIKRIAN